MVQLPPANELKLGQQPPFGEAAELWGAASLLKALPKFAAAQRVRIDLAAAAPIDAGPADKRQPADELLQCQLPVPILVKRKKDQHRLMGLDTEATEHRPGGLQPQGFLELAERDAARPVDVCQLEQLSELADVAIPREYVIGVLEVRLVFLRLVVGDLEVAPIRTAEASCASSH
eukprot:CAMPEP_0176012270 /NCGR_PEP_ID=MMETSP0120_2-20121206/5709_1 /TAXON_ID=160619 /ORGANISM="Kryptoperidinium foliaceum, Strain CCMP 1326" /LENGTH=174 /DNA_ID=CAMNT_0017345151 /DNA_START=106 /DNA_END=630 /DNA_ORIENTATION=-